MSFNLIYLLSAQICSILNKNQFKFRLYILEEVIFTINKVIYSFHKIEVSNSLVIIVVVIV